MIVTTCTHCKQFEGRVVTQASVNVSQSYAGEPAQPCERCDQLPTLMRLSEEALVASVAEQARAKLSAHWVLAILAVSCIFTLLSATLQSSKEVSPIFSSLSKDSRTDTGAQ
jgi:hypothetical protein